MRPVPDGDTLLAPSTRLGGGSLLAIDHLREDPGGGRLSRATRSAEEEGVGQPLLSYRPDQGTDHVLLPDDLIRRLRPVLTIESDLVGHRAFRTSLRESVVAVHPPLTARDSAATRNDSSGQETPRHPPAPAYRCYLPVLTRFAGWRRAGPDLQRSVPGAVPDHPGRGRVFGPARAGCGYRAPLAPHLARSPRASIPSGADTPIDGH